MIQHMRFFIGLTLFLLIACSKPTDGYWDWPRRCDLNNRIYTDIDTYNYYCNEEHAYEVDINDIITRIRTSQPRVEKNCKIDDVQLKSNFYPKSGAIDLKISFDSVAYSVGWHVAVENSYWIKRDSVGHISTNYPCSNFLPPNVDSVFMDSTCTDTLGLRSVIDVFVNFPDSLCEEQPNN